MHRHVEQREQEWHTKKQFEKKKLTIDPRISNFDLLAKNQTLF